MEPIKRRSFLKSTTATGVALGAPAIRSGWAQNSPNNRLNVCVVGLRGRGRAHIQNFNTIKNTQVTALCDVDENLFFKSMDLVDLGPGGEDPKTYVDFREMLENKDIDIVSIATPDHWHALQTIWACQAGKDVYIEKPLSYTIQEGRKMIEAARKYKRIVQIGTQHPSDQVTQKALEFVHSGELGELYMGKAVVYDYRAEIGHKPDTEIPDGVDWDLYLGPAPYRPFNENRFHYNWHWFWDTTTTEFGNNGTHWIDLIRRAMQKREHPVEVQCMGGVYAIDTDRQVPNVEAAHLKYADGKMLQLEVRNLYTNKEGCPSDRHNLLFGSKGWMWMSTSKWAAFFGKDNEPGPAMTANDIPAAERVNSTLAHFTNFVECVGTRRFEDQVADIAEGHYSSVISHLGNIAYRTGRRLHFNPYAEKFINDADADSYLSRVYRPPYTLPAEV